MIKTWCINQNGNYSKLFPTPHWSRTTMRRIITFDKSCLYTLTDPTCIKDLNKLFGFSYGHHFTNSFRFAWRCIDGATIELHRYCYIDKVRFSRKIRTLQVGVPYLMEIVHNEENGMINFNIVDNGITIKSYQPYLKSAGAGYDLDFYFGGNCRAPHKMCITSEELD